MKRRRLGADPNTWATEPKRVRESYAEFVEMTLQEVEALIAMDLDIADKKAQFSSQEITAYMTQLEADQTKVPLLVRGEAIAFKAFDKGFFDSLVNLADELYEVEDFECAYLAYTQAAESALTMFRMLAQAAQPKVREVVTLKYNSADCLNKSGHTSAAIKSLEETISFGEQFWSERVVAHREKLALWKAEFAEQQEEAVVPTLNPADQMHP